MLMGVVVRVLGMGRVWRVLRVLSWSRRGCNWLRRRRVKSGMDRWRGVGRHVRRYRCQVRGWWREVAAESRRRRVVRVGVGVGVDGRSGGGGQHGRRVRLVVDVVEESKVRLDLGGRELPRVVLNGRILRRRFDVVTGVDDAARNECRISYRTAVEGSGREVVGVGEEGMVAEEGQGAFFEDEVLKVGGGFEVQVGSKRVLAIL